MTIDRQSGRIANVGSTAPALLTKNLAVQGGKDGKLRLLDLRRMHKPPSVGRPPVLGGALQTLRASEGARVFKAPAVWRTKSRIWLFATTNRGTAGYVLEKNRLSRRAAATGTRRSWPAGGSRLGRKTQTHTSRLAS